MTTQQNMSFTTMPSRTRCFGFSDLHIQKQACTMAPTVFCHDCKLAFCSSCDQEFHFGKRPEKHRRSYAVNSFHLQPCIFREHRRRCPELGVANCETCAFTSYACLDCMRMHHWGMSDNMGHVIIQIPTESMYPSSSIYCFAF